MKHLVILLLLISSTQVLAEKVFFGNSRGADLYAQRLGNPEGLPVLMLPGYALMPETYSSLLSEELLSNYDVFIPIYRGYDNGKLKSPVTRPGGDRVWTILNNDLDFYVKFVSKLHPESKINLVGYSFGALISYVYLSGVQFKKAGSEFAISERKLTKRSEKIGKFLSLGFHPRITDITTWFDILTRVVGFNLTILDKLKVEQVPVGIFLTPFGAKKYFTKKTSVIDLMQYSKFINNSKLLADIQQNFELAAESFQVKNLLGEFDVISIQQDQKTEILNNATHPALLFNKKTSKQVSERLLKLFDPKH